MIKPEIKKIPWEKRRHGAINCWYCLDWSHCLQSLKCLHCLYCFHCSHCLLHCLSFLNNFGTKRLLCLCKIWPRSHSMTYILCWCGVGFFPHNRRIWAECQRQEARRREHLKMHPPELYPGPTIWKAGLLAQWRNWVPDWALLGYAHRCAPRREWLCYWGMGPTIKSRSAVHRAAKDLVMMMAMKTMMIMRMIRIAITSKMKRSRRSERFWQVVVGRLTS